MTELQDVIETLDNAADSFEGIANKEQKKIYDEVLTLAKDLEIDASGNVKQSIQNLKRLTLIKAKLAALSKNKEWAAGISHFLEYFGVLQKKQNEYYSSHFPEATLSVKAKEKNELMRQMAVQNTIDALMGDGLKANVTDKLNDILLRAVTSGAKFADLQEELRAHLLGKDGGQGAFARYANTYAVTALSQYTGQHNKLLTEGLNTDWFVYEGSNKETTREFCEHLTAKRFIHKSEIPTILTGKIDDYQCAIYPKTGLPYGMIDGTTPDNFQCNCGGWNCRHQLIPVADAVVPLALRQKFAKPATEKPEEKPQETKQVNLEPYQADIKAIENYIAEHPKSGKLKNYLANAYAAADAGNDADLQAILKEAKKDMAKFIASKNAVAKKKAAIQQAKVEADSAAKASMMESAKNYVQNNLVGKYNGIAYEKKWDDLWQAFKDGDAAKVYELAGDIENIAKEISTFTELVNPTELAEAYTYEELKQANDYVKGHIANWQHKGKDLIKAMQEEVAMYMDKSHPTYDVVAEAFAKKTKEIQDNNAKIKFNDDLHTILQYIAAHPKSAKIKDYYDQILVHENDGLHEDALYYMAKALADIKKFEAAAKANAKKKGISNLKQIGDKDVVLDNLSPSTIKTLQAFFDKEGEEASDTRLRGTSETQWSTLTEEERRVITKYTQTYSYLNEPLRNMRYAGTKHTDADFKRDLVTLTNALAKCRTTKDMTVRRGVSDFHIRELWKNLSEVKAGDKFTDGGFLSTAVHRDKGFHEPYNLIIYVPKGSMGFYAEPASHFTDYGRYSYNGEIWDGKVKEMLKDEREWIGQRGSRFEVLKVSGRTIYLKLIGQLYDQP